jgi:hypothetical protein
MRAAITKMLVSRNWRASRTSQLVSSINYQIAMLAFRDPCWDRSPFRL